MFYDIYEELCKRHGIAPTRAAVEMGFNKSTVSYWKHKGGSPSRDILMRISEYFNVSIEDLSDGVKSAEERQDSLSEINSVTTQNIPSISNSAPYVISDKTTEPEDIPTILNNYMSGSQSELTKDEGAASGMQISSPLPSSSYTDPVDCLDAPELEFLTDIKFTHVPHTMHERISELRRLNHMTLDNLAQAVGVDKQTIKSWESGKTNDIRRYKLSKLAKALSTTPEFLLHGDSSVKNPNNINEPRDLHSLITALSLRRELRELMWLALDSSYEEVDITLSFLRSYKTES